MASYAGANHQPVPSSNSGLVRRRDQFPPAPKSVRVVSVFGEPQSGPAPDSAATPKPKASNSVPWQLWLIAITVFLGLVAMMLARSKVFHQLGN